MTDETKLGPTQRAVLDLLRDLKDEMPSTSQIAAELSMTVDQTRNALKRLHKAGLVMVSRGKTVSAWKATPPGVVSPEQGVSFTPALHGAIPQA